MRLQRSVSRRTGGKEYVKHQVVIPDRIVRQTGWCPGDHIEARITKKGILLYRAQSPQKEERFNYDHVKEKVIKILTATPEGFCWSELRAKAGLQQATPSPILVRQLEEEIGLKRVLDKTTSRVIWKLPIERLESSASTLNGWTQNPEEPRARSAGGEEVEKHHG